MLMHDGEINNPVNLPPVSLFIEAGIKTVYVRWWHCARLRAFISRFLSWYEEDLEEGDVWEDYDMYG